MREMVRFAVHNSKFFNKYYSGYDLDDIWSLPTVNKKIMMENLGDYNTVGLTKEEIINFCLEVDKEKDFSRRLHGLNVAMSSGTSGNKGVEIVTPEEENYLKAALFSRFDLPKGEKVNLAFILRVSAPAFNLNKFGHKLTYISQLNLIEEINKKLYELQPNIISAPPSMLKLIAKEIGEGRLSIKPKKLVSYAEVLYPDVREYLEKVFNCKVYEIYKCTEGAVAISCRQGSLHINEDIVAVQTFNEDGSVTPPGKPCHKLVVTDLHKKSQLIIRYELNDIITISPEKCPCSSSFRVIASIQGRSDDLFWAKRIDNSRWQFIFPDYISRAIITSSEEIDEYQVVQKGAEEILVRIQTKNESSKNSQIESKIRENLEKVFSGYNCEKPNVEVLFEKPEFNKNSGKLIRIHRDFKIEGD